MKVKLVSDTHLADTGMDSRADLKAFSIPPLDEVNVRSIRLQR